jgi:hypothetical protein
MHRDLSFNRVFAAPQRAHFTKKIKPPIMYIERLILKRSMYYATFGFHPKVAHIA